nr:fas-associated death domain protein-like [Parasteatoda tepidariorum]
MANEERYTKTKNYVMQLIGDKYDLEKLKNFFKGDIDSPRTLKKIRAIKDLITVLEERDCLNYQSPMPLFYIGEILENEVIKKVIQLYKQCYLEGQAIVCLCGQKVDYCPSSSCLQLEGNCSQKSSLRINSSNNDLMDAIKNVADQIDLKFWRVLTSQLKVEEGIIDEIYETYPKDPKKQVLAAMEYWMKNEKENATVEQLDKALDARLCKRKGIGSHLRKPVVKLCL